MDLVILPKFLGNSAAALADQFCYVLAEVQQQLLDANAAYKSRADQKRCSKTWRASDGASLQRESPCWYV